MALEPAADSEALKAIERTNEALLFTPRDGLSAAFADDVVKDDIVAYRTIQDSDVRHLAAVTMGDNAESQAHYKAALLLQAPDIAKDVNKAVAEKERRSANDIPGNSISQGIDRERMDEEVPAPIGIRPRVTPDAAHPASPANDRAQESEAGKDPDGPKGFKPPASLTRRFLHANDQYYFREDTTVLAFELVNDKIRSVHTDPDVARSMVELAEAKGWKTLILKGTDEFKREAWLEATARGLATKGYEPRDVDRTLLTEVRAQRDRAHATAGDARHGDHVTAGKELSANSPIDESAGKKQKDVTPAMTDETPKISPQQRTAIDALQGLLKERGDSPQQIAAVVTEANKRFLQARAYVGRLVEHGRAPYHFDDKNGSSYYARLESKDGKQKVVWGVDLERAIKDGGVKPGDDIVVADQGRKEAVSVTVNEHDASGQVNGQRVIMGQRVAWATQKVDALRDAARIAVERLADRTTKQPVVKVYDRQAARPVVKSPPQRTPMPPQRNRDQTR